MRFVPAATILPIGKIGDQRENRRHQSNAAEKRSPTGSPPLASTIPAKRSSFSVASLPFAPIDLATAARVLRSSRRSLQRKLEAEGTSFATIFDRVRAGLARSYLLESRLSVAEIAELLGYSETGALTRAVRRWFGENPRRVRRLAN